MKRAEPMQTPARRKTFFRRRRPGWKNESAKGARSNPRALRDQHYTIHRPYDGRAPIDARYPKPTANWPKTVQPQWPH